MAADDLQQLERDVEAARTKLTADIATLRSPGTFSEFTHNLKQAALETRDNFIDDARTRTRSAIEEMVETVKEKAVANPAATLVIGAGIAWHLIRRPPVATALIGGGLFSLLRTDASARPPNGHAEPLARARDLNRFLRLLDLDGNRIRVWPAQPRATYCPTLFFDPRTAENKAALGFDLGADPALAEAMAEARDTGEPSASRRVDGLPVWDTVGSGRVVLFIPVYRSTRSLENTEARRRAIFGHYRMGPWMRFQTDPAAYITPERWDAMTPRQRELMRMTHGVGQKNAADYYPDQPHAGRYD